MDNGFSECQLLFNIKTKLKTKMKSTIAETPNFGGGGWQSPVRVGVLGTTDFYASTI